MTVRTTTRQATLAALLILGGLAARADGGGERAEPWERDGGASPTAPIPALPSRSPLAPPRPAIDQHDRATLGDPAPRVYGQQPTLGDPRPYRRSPRIHCGSLLCD